MEKRDTKPCKKQIKQLLKSTFVACWKWIVEDNPPIRTVLDDYSSLRKSRYVKSSYKLSYIIIMITFTQLKIELELIIGDPIKDTEYIWEEQMEESFKQAENEASNRSQFRKVLDDQQQEILSFESVEG